MISIDLARQLKLAGLEWRPTECDFFAIPDHQLDDQVFVVSPLPALVQPLHGLPTVTFHGSIEWALDYVLLVDVVWLPNETQLREAIDRFANADAPLQLERHPSHYLCRLTYANRTLVFEAATGEDAYATALLYILQNHTPTAV